MPKSQSRFDEEVELEIAEPEMYRVLLLNDDFTTMEFVVNILKEVFHKQQKEAERIMLDVHKKGSGVCGVYPFEIAEAKVKIVTERAKSAGFPLRCTMEEA